MARIYGEILSSALMTFDKSFSRSNGQPLDSTEVFYSLVAAQDYAKTDVAYVGQKIVVIETVDEVTTVTHYGIEADNSLKELGAIPVGDGLTVEIVDGKIQLADIADHSEGTYQPYLVDGQIEWRVPSATTVEGLDSRLTSAEGDIDALQAAVGQAASEGVEADGLFKAVADNTAAIEAEATARGEAITTLTNAVDEKIGEVAEGKTVVEMISDAQTAATYDDTDVKAGIKDNADAIAEIAADYLKVEDKYDDTDLSNRVKGIEDDYLTSEDKTELSDAIEAAEESAVDRVLGYLAEEVVNEKYDTLKEVAAWIESDTTASAELITRVSAIEADYLKTADKTALSQAMGKLDEDLRALIGTIPEDVQSEDVVSYIQEAIAGLNIGDYVKQTSFNELAEDVAAVEEKLEGIAEGAQVNVIDSVDEAQFALDASKKLTLLDIAMGKVTGLADALAGKVDVEENKRLMTNAEGTLLATIEEGAQVNKIETVDEAQFVLDENKHLTLLDIAMGKVTGLQTALDSKADKGTTLAEYGITDAYTKEETLDKIEEKITEINGGESAGEVLSQLNSYKEINDAAVDTIEAKLETIESNAQVNKIEEIKIGETILDIVDKSVAIPVGAGLKASTEVTIAADGTIGVGQVNVNKLVQTDGDDLILNGGTAG